MNTNLLWRRAILALLCGVMLLSLFACEGGAENESESRAQESTAAETVITDETGEISTESVKETESTDMTETAEKTESETAATAEAATEIKTEGTTEASSETDSETVKATETVETTEKTETTETTETIEESEEIEVVYGYDFKDASWKTLFDVAGQGIRDIDNDPAGSENVVLCMTHGAGETASWVRNKNDFETGNTGKITVSADLYIPSGALAAAGDYVQLQVNGDYNHHVNLVSDAKENLSAFDTKDFPRDKWFTVRFAFDMDKLRYNLEVVEDGEVRTVVFAARSAASIKETGPLKLRVFLGGENNKVYVDHMGVVTQSTIEKEEIEVAKGVGFIRIDGLNVAGEKLTVYGDFTGGATVADLTDLVWERSDSYSGTYSAVSGANGAAYTPKDGGYYLRISAKYGKKTLVSYPVYVRKEAELGFVKGYLSLSGSELTASFVYNNENPAFEAEMKVVVYDGSKAIKTYTEKVTLKQGSDVLSFTYEDASLSGKRAEMTLTSGGKQLGDTAEIDNTLPRMIVLKANDGTSVLANKKQIAHFKQNRYMRFRPSLENDHWIGTENNPIDMGFAYQEKAVAGLKNISVESVTAPGIFKVVFSGEKVGIKTTQRNELIGFWDAEKQEFTFIYNCSMTANSEAWHQNSTWAASGRIEPFDYHLERMSILDRVYNKNMNGDLYDYVIYENGNELVRIPKLPVPRTAIKGKYFYGFFLSPGESVYYPDPVEGGWKSTVLSDSGDAYLEICWSWYDIHSCSENSVPALGSSESFTVSQSWLFETTSAQHDKTLIDAATEVEWRDLPNYQLPLFSTNNTFETQFGGIDWQYAWWKSTYDCTMDAEVGHDGAGSVKIEKTSSGAASWYTEGVWGFPYSFDEVDGKTYRFSGYIKTENVVGEAYIANEQYRHETPNSKTVTVSDSVTGTSDWTYVSFTFTGKQRTKDDGTKERCVDHFFLTLNGTGTVWFDDVKIEEVN